MHAHKGNSCHSNHLFADMVRVLILAWLFQLAEICTPTLLPDD